MISKQLLCAALLMGLAPSFIVCEGSSDEQDKSQKVVTERPQSETNSIEEESIEKSLLEKFKAFRLQALEQWKEVSGNELTAAALNTGKKMYEKSPESVYFGAGFIFAKCKKLRLLTLASGGTYLYMKNKTNN